MSAKIILPLAVLDNHARSTGDTEMLPYINTAQNIPRCSFFVLHS